MTVETSPSWRRAGRSHAPVAGFWLLTFWLILALQFGMGWPPPAAVVAAPAFSLLGLATGTGLWTVVASRWPTRAPAAACPPPPDAFEPADGATFARAPRVSYPPRALARGQCGWVALRLRSGRGGRIDSYVVVDQAPGRVFERAAVSALSNAFLTEGSAGEVRSLITFVTPGPGAPPWAQERLEGQPRAGA